MILIKWFYKLTYSFITGEIRPTAYKLSSSIDNRYYAIKYLNTLKQYTGNILNVPANKILKKYV